MCTGARPFTFKLLPRQGGLQGEEPSETEHLLRQAQGKQAHHFLDRSGGSSKASLSSAHQPQHCQPLILSGFSTDTASFPIYFFFQETLPDEPVRPICSLHSSDFYTWMISPAFPGFPNSEDKYCPALSSPAPKGHGLRDPLASLILAPSTCPA